MPRPWMSRTSLNPLARASFKYSSTTGRTSLGAKAWRSRESSIGRLTGSGSSMCPRSARTEVDDRFGDHEVRLALLLLPGLIGHAAQERILVGRAAQDDDGPVGVNALEYYGGEVIASLPALVGQVLLEGLRPGHAARRGEDQ